MQECRKDQNCPKLGMYQRLGGGKIMFIPTKVIYNQTLLINSGPSPKRLPSFKAKPAPKAKSSAQPLPSSPSPKRNPSVKPKPFPKAKTGVW